MTGVRGALYSLTDAIVPLDPLEQEHKNFTLQWIKSGAELFRLQKPDIPKTHGVSYFLALNPRHDKVLLGHHKIADLWLPGGGHIDKGEHPQETAKRERQTDVSFWFVIEINDQVQIDFCQNEYYRMEWFEFDKIPFEKSEPHMRRFLHKLESFLKKDKGNPFLSCLP